MPKGFGVNRGQKALGDTVRRHYEMVDNAIATGDMSKVKRANEQGWRREQAEVKSYGAMK
jgi:hypothetical protein